MTRVKPARSERALVKIFKARHLNPDLFTVEDMVKTTLGFYGTVRAAVSPEPDSDMMLFEWGTFDWGNGEFFQVSMTRQFTEKRLFGGDPRLSQLHARVYFDSPTRFATLGKSHIWCHSIEELGDFTLTVMNGSIVDATATLSPHHSEILWNPI